jgi:hypothetical protein
LKKDPLETKNLAQDQNHQQVLKKMRLKLTRKIQQLKEAQLVEEAPSQEQIKF